MYNFRVPQQEEQDRQSECSDLSWIIESLRQNSSDDDDDLWHLVGFDRRDADSSGSSSVQSSSPTSRAQTEITDNASVDNAVAQMTMVVSLYGDGSQAQEVEEANVHAQKFHASFEGETGSVSDQPGDDSMSTDYRPSSQLPYNTTTNEKPSSPSSYDKSSEKLRKYQRRTGDRYPLSINGLGSPRSTLFSSQYSSPRQTYVPHGLPTFSPRLSRPMDSILMQTNIRDDNNLSPIPEKDGLRCEKISVMEKIIESKDLGCVYGAEEKLVDAPVQGMVEKIEQNITIPVLEMVEKGEPNITTPVQEVVEKEEQNITIPVSEMVEKIEQNIKAPVQEEIVEKRADTVYLSVESSLRETVQYHENKENGRETTIPEVVAEEEPFELHTLQRQKTETSLTESPRNVKEEDNTPSLLRQSCDCPCRHERWIQPDYLTLCLTICGRPYWNPRLQLGNFICDYQEKESPATIEKVKNLNKESTRVDESDFNDTDEFVSGYTSLGTVPSSPRSSLTSSLASFENFIPNRESMRTVINKNQLPPWSPYLSHASPAALSSIGLKLELISPLHPTEIRVTRLFGETSENLALIYLTLTENKVFVKFGLTPVKQFLSPEILINKHQSFLLMFQILELYKMMWF